MPAHYCPCEKATASHNVMSTISIFCSCLESLLLQEYKFGSCISTSPIFNLELWTQPAT